MLKLLVFHSLLFHKAVAGGALVPSGEAVAVGGGFSCSKQPAPLQHGLGRAMTKTNPARREVRFGRKQSNEPQTS